MSQILTSRPPWLCLPTALLSMMATDIGVGFPKISTSMVGK